jgi:protein-tyrosine phosphatase
VIAILVDLHCHILPNMDDGAFNEFETLKMAQQAVQTGITHIIATPHHLNGKFDNPKKHIQSEVDRINALINQEEIPLTILPGQEARLSKNLIFEYRSEKMLTLNNTGKYMLVELPASSIPDDTADCLYELLIEGITPIIAHPERNKEIINNPEILYSLVSEGILTQITSDSIIGRLGKNVKSFSEKMLENNLTHFIASDAHDSKVRDFSLIEAYKEVEFKFGSNVRKGLEQNAVSVVRSEGIIPKSPTVFKSKKILGIF